MDNFEQKLSRLEELSNAIKQSDISLEEALAHFEEGIKLARSMQQYLDEMEGKVQILMNPQAAAQSVETPPADEAADGAKQRKEAKASKKSTAKGDKAQDQEPPVLALFDDTTAVSISSGDIKGTRA